MPPKKMIRSLLTLLVLLSVRMVMAQAACMCCDTTYRQFDFWVGEWVVEDTLGQIVGENRITSIQDSCVVLEEWTGAKGTTGMSMNYYDRTDSTWHQVWVDNFGSVLNLRGRLSDGVMVLKSTLLTGQKIGAYYHQISWTPNVDGTITQRWETYDQQGKLLRTLFEGIYRHKE